MSSAKCATRCCRWRGFSAAVKVDDARAKAWYDAHPDDYLSKESVRLQYAELRLDTIAAAHDASIRRILTPGTSRTRAATWRPRSAMRSTS